MRYGHCEAWYIVLTLSLSYSHNIHVYLVSHQKYALISTNTLHGAKLSAQHL
jgi:hypothetical protein